MQFRDLRKQYQVLKTEMDQAMAEVLESAGYISGRQVTELEEALARYVGVKHCITCANGTDALTLALMSWGIGEGDAVFVPDFTFFSSAETVAYEGAVPVFTDILEDTCSDSRRIMTGSVRSRTITACIFWKMRRRGSAVPARGDEPAVSGILPRPPFFRQSRWGATETAAPSLQIPTTGRRLFVLSGFMERAVISTTMCASA